MVVAKFELDAKRKKISLHVKGHANANVVGHDIVCASVSILSYTLAQTVQFADGQDKLKYSPRIKLKDGDAIISCQPKDDIGYAELLNAYLVIQNGYLLLARNYPQYVAIEMFGDDDSIVEDKSTESST